MLVFEYTILFSTVQRFIRFHELNIRNSMLRTNYCRHFVFFLVRQHWYVLRNFFVTQNRVGTEKENRRVQFIFLKNKFIYII